MSSKKSTHKLTMPLSSNSSKRHYSDLHSSHNRVQRFGGGHSGAVKPSKHQAKDSSSLQTIIGSRVSKKVTASVSRKQKKNPALSDTIRVFVNNRLGTRAEIICSPSDTVGDFKKLTAMKLGLQAEGITLKRQGQRSLKNAITLQDYEIGSGSSLDLEVDTSD